MTPPGLRDAALVVHVVLPVDDGSPDGSGLDALWAAAVSAERLDIPTEVGSAYERFAERQEGAEIVQAVVRRTHDVRVLSVVLAPGSAHPSAWAQLDNRWEAVVSAAGDPGSAVGAVRIYQGWVPSVPALAVDALPVHLMARVPGSRPDRNGYDHGRLAGDGVVVWEVGDAAPLRAERRLVVLCADVPDADAQLTRWTWAREPAALTPLIRYLVHAAKIRYEFRLFSAREGAVRTARARVDRESRDVLRRVVGNATPDEAAADALLAACQHAEIAVADLVQVRAQLQTVRRTAEIGVANRERAIPVGPGPAADLVEDDSALGAALLARMADEIDYGDGVLAGARDTIATVRATVERRADQMAAARDRRRESFALLQAALIGALALLLTAIQSLGYHVPLDVRLNGALVSVCGAAALTLGLVLIRRHEIDGVIASAGRRRLLDSTVVAGVAGAGAALGWFVETLLRVVVLQVEPSVTWSVGSASVAAVLAALVASVLLKRS